MFTTEMILVFLVIVGSYTMLIRALRRYSREHSHELNDNYVKNQRKAAHAIFIIVTCFILMNFSLILMPFITYTIATIDIDIVMHLYNEVFCVSNSVLNPLIYSFRTPLLKEHILKLFGRNGNNVHPAPWITMEINYHWKYFIYKLYEHSPTGFLNYCTLCTFY